MAVHRRGSRRADRMGRKGQANLTLAVDCASSAPATEDALRSIAPKSKEIARRAANEQARLAFEAVSWSTRGMVPPPSPCTRVCRIDPRSGWCLGCRRTLAEIADWPLLSSAEQRALLADLPRRG